MNFTEAKDFYHSRAFTRISQLYEFFQKHHNVWFALVVFVIVEQVYIVLNFEEFFTLYHQILKFIIILF